MVAKNIFLYKIEWHRKANNWHEYFFHFHSFLPRSLVFFFRTTIYFLSLCRVAYVQLCKEDALLYDTSIAKKTDTRLSKSRNFWIVGTISFHDVWRVFHPAYTNTFVHLRVVPSFEEQKESNTTNSCLFVLFSRGKRPVQNWRLSFIVAVNPA